MSSIRIPMIINRRVPPPSFLTTISSLTGPFDFIVSYNPQTTVAGLKQSLQDRFIVPISRIQLTFEGHVLTDDQNVRALLAHADPFHVIKFSIH